MRSLLCTLLFFVLLFLVRGTPYKYRTYANISATLLALAKKHPEILKVYSAQEKFSLPFVGRCKQYTSNGTLSKLPCHIWVAEITEHATLSTGDITRPEMLVSGEVHGDEVIGPQASIAFIEYMVSAYVRGDQFARRMLAQRIVTIIPTTNAIGYELGVREELQTAMKDSKKVHAALHGEHGHHAYRHVHHDPNRDFPFDNHPRSCMRTVAARVINELMLERMFYLLITLHGGTNVIAYEWGDKQHCNHLKCAPAPDYAIMRRLALRLRDAAGTAGAFESKYPIGNMGETVYPVHGGMEDWAYGGSWSGQGVVCDPRDLGGYPPDKTKYTPAMTRAVTYLVETGFSKRPGESALGGDSNPMVRGAKDDGHVPRNIRLLATALDNLAPYVTLHERNRVPFSDASDHGVTLTWRVGGAFVVDGTYLQWGTKDGRDGVTKVQTGIAGPNGTVFNATVPFNTAAVPSTATLYVRAAAVADNSLDVKVKAASPNMLPQSHLLASRAHGGWKHRIGSRVVMAKRVVYSPTLRIESFESYVRVVIDNTVMWGPGTGRVPAPAAGAVLRTLYPNAYRVDTGYIWAELRTMNARSWGFFALLLVLWALPCCVLYQRRARRKREIAAIVSENSSNPLIDEEVLS